MARTHIMTVNLATHGRTCMEYFGGLDHQILSLGYLNTTVPWPGIPMADYFLEMKISVTK